MGVCIEMSEMTSARRSTLVALAQGPSTLLQVDPKWTPPRRSCCGCCRDFFKAASRRYQAFTSYGPQRWMQKNSKVMFLSIMPIMRIFTIVNIFRAGSYWLGAIAILLSHLSILSIWLLLHQPWGNQGERRVKAFKKAFERDPTLCQLFRLDAWVVGMELFGYSTCQHQAYAKLHIVMSGTVEGPLWLSLQLFMFLKARTHNFTVLPSFGMATLTDDIGVCNSVPNCLFTIYVCYRYVKDIASITHEGNQKRFFNSLLMLGEGMPPPALIENLLSERNVCVRDDLSEMDASGALALARTISRSITLQTLVLRDTKIELSEARKVWARFTDEISTTRTLRKIWFNPDKPRIELDNWSFQSALRLEEVHNGEETVYQFAPPCDEGLFVAIENHVCGSKLSYLEEELERLRDHGSKAEIHKGALWAAKTGNWRALRHIMAEPTSQKVAHDLACAAAGEGHVQCVQLLMDACYSDWAEPLKCASGRAQDEVVYLLIAYGMTLTDDDEQASLTQAAIKDDVHIAKALLDARAEPNDADPDGVFPLIACAENAAHKMTQALLAARADPNIRDSEDRTPLWAASAMGNIETMRKLLAARANLELPGPKGARPLEAAVDCSHAEAIKMLLGNGANVGADDANGAELVAVAVQSGNAEVLRHLVAGRAQVDKKNVRVNTPLTMAVKAKRHDLVDMLLAAGANLDVEGTNGYTPVARAIERGDEAITKSLLKARANVDASGAEQPPVRMAVDAGNLKILLHLLAARADPDVGLNTQHVVETPLVVALGSKRKQNDGSAHLNIDMARMLLQAGARADVPTTDSGITLLAKAVFSLKIDQVNLLLDAKANPEVRDTSGELVLATATKRNHIEITKALLEAGASATGEWSSGRSILEACVEERSKGDVIIITALIEANADPMKPNNKGLSVFALAIQRSDLEVIRLIARCLISQEADPDVAVHHVLSRQSAAAQEQKVSRLPSKPRFTHRCADLLVVAAKQGNPEIVGELLALRVSLNERDAQGQTPLAAAAAANNVKVIDVLLQAGASVNETAGPNDESPLAAAVRGKAVQVAKALIKAGATVDENALTCAQEIAAKTGNAEMSNLLKSSVLEAAGYDYDKDYFFADPM